MLRQRKKSKPLFICVADVKGATDSSLPVAAQVKTRITRTLSYSESTVRINYLVCRNKHVKNAL